MKYSTIGFVQRGPFNGATVGIQALSEYGPYQPVAAFDGPFSPMNVGAEDDVIKALVSLTVAAGPDAVIEWASVPCHSLRVTPSPDGPPMNFDLAFTRKARQLAEITFFVPQVQYKQKIDAEFIAPIPVPVDDAAPAADTPEKDKGTKGRKRASTPEPN